MKNILLRDDFCDTLKKLNIINAPLPVDTAEVIEARRVLPYLCGTVAILSGVFGCKKYLK